MKQKLLSGLIALFLCLSNVSAGDNLNNIFKKYQKYKGEEIICEQLDLPKELRKAKAGKTSKDINIDELQQSIDMGISQGPNTCMFLFGECICFGTYNRSIHFKIGERIHE